MSRIKWGRSDEGFVESKCGRWHITPLYWGCTRPQAYALRDAKTKKKIGAWYETQWDAKQKALDVLLKEQS